MSPGRRVWLALLLAGGAIELRAVLVNPAGEDTLSEFTRWAFRTHTRAGAVTFAVAALSFGGWFIPHILRRKDG